MASSEQNLIVPLDSGYEPPCLEVLGQLADLAEGQGEHGQLIVMQTGGGIPGD